VAAVQAAGRRAHAVSADLADADAPARVFAEVEATLGPVSILVNNASAWRKDTFSVGPEGRRRRPDEAVTGDTALPQLLVDARAGALMIAELASSVRCHRLGWGRIVSLTSGDRWASPARSPTAQPKQRSRTTR
jgi:3-oxoacyl-[acyl-carrier protein] reductase